MTTTDALQIQHHYCPAEAGFNRKKTVKCPKRNRLDQDTFVFEDRLCDNKRDCPDGGDEGKIKSCEQVQEFTPDGCCANVIFTYGATQIECNYKGNRNLIMNL